MGLFVYSEEHGSYAVEVDGVRLLCENPDDFDPDYVQEFAEAYGRQLPELVEFMVEDICDFFGEIEVDALPGLLGVPTVDLDRDTVTYLDHTLDDVHIIEVEFGGAFEEFYEVVIDG